MPGTLLWIAVSITVAPTIASIVRAVPAKSMKVIFGMRAQNPERKAASRPRPVLTAQPRARQGARDKRLCKRKRWELVRPQQVRDRALGLVDSGAQRR